MADPPPVAPVAAVDSYDDVDLSDDLPSRAKARRGSPCTTLCRCAACLAVLSAVLCAVSGALFSAATMRSPVFSPVTGTGYDEPAATDASAPDPASNASNVSLREPIRGVNLGGWLVLEPWITPSLFYEFLDDDRPATDEKTLCEKLGSEEAARRLGAFRDAWVTEEDFARLAALGINSARLPYGYWSFGDASDFCPNVSSVAYLDRAVSWAEKHGIRLLLDMHGARGSQNGFDNSGESHKAPWGDPLDGTGWLSRENRDATLSALSRAAARYAASPAVAYMGLVNEPIGFHFSGFCDRNCPIPVPDLIGFYNEAWEAIKAHMPHAQPVLDSSFRPHVWAPLRAPDQPWLADGALLDTHRYHGFWPRASRLPQVAHLRLAACGAPPDIREMADEAVPVVVGEWSTAVSDCMTWLNGLGVPVGWSDPADCARVPCPTTFSNGSLPAFVQEGRDPPPGAAGGPDKEGLCGVDPSAPPRGPLDYDAFYRTFYAYAMGGYEASAGWFFWNFKNELRDPRWGFLDAADHGWLPEGGLRGFRPPAPDCAQGDAGSVTWQSAMGMLIATGVLTPLLTLIAAVAWLAARAGCCPGRGGPGDGAEFARMMTHTPGPTPQNSVEMTTAVDRAGKQLSDGEAYDRARV
mmetsp:Transcript_23280/g.78231  ORF Transcript_23280/g.78231 Transcript_23280/m.78231 type:complete len:637 (+) Transcript_23280:3-1913(+)